MQNQVKAVLKKMLVQSVRIDIDSNKIRERKKHLHLRLLENLN